MLPGTANLRDSQPHVLSMVSVEQYSYSTSGTADIDTLNNVFRFNITSLTYKNGDKTVINTKPRATTLLMYDVLPLSYSGDALFSYGMNYTWSSPTCSCATISPENGGGSVRLSPFFVACRPLFSSLLTFCSGSTLLFASNGYLPRK